MTPAQEAALLDQIAADIDQAMANAFADYQKLVLAGEKPRDAVMTVMATFQGEFSNLLAAAFSAVLATSVGSPSVLQMQVGTVTLSTRLYQDAQELSVIVQGIADRHVQGFQDARKLAFDLYEGYDFRPNGDTLKFSRQSSLIPRYLKDALLPELSGDFDTIFAQIQVDNLKTLALKAAYQGVLNGIDGLEKGPRGEQVLVSRLRVAWEEKARYLANRIAQTELHRAFAERQAAELMLDTDVDYVQWRMSATHPETDICDFFAEVDIYGLGGGVYPKATAPVPTAHPFCRCVLAPRLDLTGRKATFRPNAANNYFAMLPAAEAAKVAGSKAKLADIIGGDDPIDVHNRNVPAAYQVKTVQQAANSYLGATSP